MPGAMNLGGPQVWLLMGFFLLLCLAGVLVAMDAREQGMSKFAAVLWFFATIFLYGFPAAVYLFFRNSGVFKKLMAARKSDNGPGAKGDTEKEKNSRFCPYCGAPLKQEDKICSRCSKIL